MAREKGSGSFREIERGGKKLYEYRIDGKSFYSKTKSGCRTKYQEWKENSHESRIERIVYFRDWATEWLESYKHHKVADGTYNNYKLYVEKHIIPYFGVSKIKDIRPAQIEKFMATEKDLSESARHHIWITLNAIFETARKNRLVDENPCGEYVKPREEKDKAAKIHFFEHSQLERLITAANNIDDGYYILIPLYTGMRLGELCGLRWEDISEDVICISRSVGEDENSKPILKATKAGKRRFIGIPDKLAEVLSKTPHKGAYVLSNSDDYFSINQLPNRYKTAFKHANKYLIANGLEPVEYLSMHKCRHTYATYLANGGAAAKDIQEILGHADISTTQIYFHVDTESIKKATNKLAY